MEEVLLGADWGVFEEESFLKSVPWERAPTALVMGVIGVHDQDFAVWE